MKLLKQANGNIVRTEEEKESMIKKAAHHYGKFLEALGFDWEADKNSENTPTRYAKSMVEDLISGSLTEEPKITAFPNTNKYPGIICQTRIKVNSLCSHHHREVQGLAHVAYIPSENGLVIGLSKLNRIVYFFSKRFQLQEDLTKQIAEHINLICKDNKGVAVLIEATHGCVKCRGVQDDSKMFTCELTGVFLDNNDKSREEFYKMIQFSKSN